MKTLAALVEESDQRIQQEYRKAIEKRDFKMTEFFFKKKLAFEVQKYNTQYSELKTNTINTANLPFSMLIISAITGTTK